MDLQVCSIGKDLKKSGSIRDNSYQLNYNPIMQTTTDNDVTNDFTLSVSVLYHSIKSHVTLRFCDADDPIHLVIFHMTYILTC